MFPSGPAGRGLSYFLDVTMREHRAFLFRFVRSFLVFFTLCFTVAFLIMSKREFDEVTINQVLFHMQ